MKDYKLTVSCITYNHEKYIEKCLKSLLAQKTDFDFIIKIYDDCSTDATTKICKEYAEKYSDLIQFYPNEKNLGPTLNSLRSYRNIQTPYYLFIEGDDYCYTFDKFQKQVDILDKHPECSFCATTAIAQYSPKTMRYPYPNLKTGVYSLDDIMLAEYQMHTHLPSRIVRTDCIAIDENNLDAYLFDSTQTYELLEQGNMYFIDEVTVVYNMMNNTGLWTGKNVAEKFRFVTDLFLKYNEYKNYKYEKPLLKSLMVQENSAYDLAFNKQYFSDDIYAEPLKIPIKKRVKAIKHYLFAPCVIDLLNTPRNVSRKLREYCRKDKNEQTTIFK